MPVDVRVQKDHGDEVPEDLRFPRDFTPASLDAQIAAAREEMHRFQGAHYAATQRQRGHGSMHWNTYAAGYHRRRSVLFTLLQLKHKQESQAT